MTSAFKSLVRHELKNCAKEHKENGFNAIQFRERIKDLYMDSPKSKIFWIEALLDTANQVYQEQPRKSQILFDGRVCPEFITRYGPKGRLGKKKDYEIVGIEYATVADFSEDTDIKMGVAIKTMDAAKRQMETLRIALRRANGDHSVFLRDIKDGAKKREEKLRIESPPVQPSALM
jgi:hypothetical protein